MEGPVPIKVPPQELVYQLIVEPVPLTPPTAVSVVELPVQICVAPDMLVGAVDKVFTVIATELLFVHPFGDDAVTV